MVEHYIEDNARVILSNSKRPTIGKVYLRLEEFNKLKSPGVRKRTDIGIKKLWSYQILSKLAAVPEYVLSRLISGMEIA